MDFEWIIYDYIKIGFAWVSPCWMYKDCDSTEEYT